jgi:hypothetical protein
VPVPFVAVQFRTGASRNANTHITQVVKSEVVKSKSAVLRAS